MKVLQKPSAKGIQRIILLACNVTFFIYLPNLYSANSPQNTFSRPNSFTTGIFNIFTEQQYECQIPEVPDVTQTMWQFVLTFNL